MVINQKTIDKAMKIICEYDSINLEVMRQVKAIRRLTDADADENGEINANLLGGIIIKKDNLKFFKNSMSKLSSREMVTDADILIDEGFNEYEANQILIKLNAIGYIEFVDKNSNDGKVYFMITDKGRLYFENKIIERGTFIKTIIIPIIISAITSLITTLITIWFT